MQERDQPDDSTDSQVQTVSTSAESAEIDSSTLSTSLSASQKRASGFDWLAVSVVMLIAAFFAITARLHTQPANSLVPAAVLSATGCGLLITALRTLRTTRGSGLFEAGLGGYFVALFQFIAAITYPGVFDSLGTDQPSRQGFFITWGLIAGFSVIFSVAGAALGHLAFAPLRPLPFKPIPSGDAENDVTIEELEVDHTEEEEDISNSTEDESDNTEPVEQVIPARESTNTTLAQRPRTFFSYLVTMLLLGLAPTLVAYIFAAAYDYILHLSSFAPGPYPTLRLLSALLPWQVPAAINLSGSEAGFIITILLWRIPLFFGNPGMFDLQALEPFVFNGAALGILLLMMHGQDANTAAPSSPRPLSVPPPSTQTPLAGLAAVGRLLRQDERRMSWRMYLVLEAVFGLILVLPANVWLLRGLQGILQLGNIAIPIRSLHILDPLTFTLNLITGPAICLAIGILLRSQPINRPKAR